MSQLENVKRSLERYLYDNLYDIEGISIDFSGLPFNDKNIKEWIVPRFLVDRNYVSLASGNEYGYNNNIILNITINVKKSSLTISDRHYILRDTIVRYFNIGQDIDLNSWVDESKNIICYMRVRDIIEDYSLNETNDLLSYKIVLGINYIEKNER